QELRRLSQTDTITDFRTDEALGLCQAFERIYLLAVVAKYGNEYRRLLKITSYFDIRHRDEPDSWILKSSADDVAHFFFHLFRHAVCPHCHLEHLGFRYK